jgi:hypothetical protein
MPLLMKAQIWQESRFNPDCQSLCGGKGLMQLMPETAKEMSQATVRKSQENPDLFDPETNINLGIKYDRVQFDHFPEISEREEQLMFMLGAYNCGRGYDINVELVTLYRVVKSHLDEFIRYLRWLLAARDEFERFKKENPETLTDIQRAVRFYFLLKAGFGSKIKSPTFSCAPSRPSNFNLLRIEEELSAIHMRLTRV